MITQERLKQLLNYDPETGIFERNRWVGRRGKVHGIRKLGTQHEGYIRIRLDGVKYMAHRLAWLYVYGEFPEKQIDHINHDKSDNRICNLREATQIENSQNKIRATRLNKLGVLGVSQVYGGKFKATITINKERKVLGYGFTAQEAHELYLSAKRLHHEFCTI